MIRVGSGQTVHLDGIFLMEFNGQRGCTLFREWWHSDENNRLEHPALESRS